MHHEQPQIGQRFQQATGPLASCPRSAPPLPLPFSPSFLAFSMRPSQDTEALQMKPAELFIDKDAPEGGAHGQGGKVEQ